MQDKLRELLRDSVIWVGCVEEVRAVERALFSVGGYWSSRGARYLYVPKVAGYLVVNSELFMEFKLQLSGYDIDFHKVVSVKEIKNLMDSTEQVSENEYKTEISLGSEVVLRTNGKVIYEGSGIVVVE